MARAVLIDDLRGDPTKFYEFVESEVKRRGIPNVSFRTRTVSGRKTGWLAREQSPALEVRDPLGYVLVFAYQYGRAFHVATKAFWNDRGMAQREREGKLNWGEEVISGCFDESVDRAVEAALLQYLESIGYGAPPADLAEKRGRYERSAHVTDE